MPQPFFRILVAALPYALPSLGGLIGIAWVNITPGSNPFIGIALGILAGWALSALLLGLLDRNS